MKFTRKDVIIGFGNKFVGGYSLKLNKVWYTSKQTDAKKFTAVTAGNFLFTHAKEWSESEMLSIKIIRLNWNDGLNK